MDITVHKGQGKLQHIIDIGPLRLLTDEPLQHGGEDTGPNPHELIALAVAVTLRCDGCITTHTDATAKHRASREEIAEALGVAIAVNAGAALVYSARVMDAFSVKQP